MVGRDRAEVCAAQWPGDSLEVSLPSFGASPALHPKLARLVMREGIVKVSGLSLPCKHSSGGERARQWNFVQVALD